MITHLRINNQIRGPQIMVIDDQGKQLGVMSVSDALKIAHEADLDLVEVGPTAQPPIAKIMDYGKYIYQKEKQEKQSKTKHREHETKTVRVGFKTGEHDLNVKAKKADEFLAEGNNVKLELTLRGREKALAHLGKDKLIAFLKRLTIPHITQAPPQRGPYGWVVMVQRDKKVSTKPKHVTQSENEKSASEAHQDNGKQKDSETATAPESL